MLLLTSYSSGGGERTYEYGSHEHGSITTWPPHKGFAGLLGRNQKGFSEQGGLDRSFFVELNAANVTGCFLVFAKICAGLNCDIAVVTKGIPHPRTAPK